MARKTCIIAEVGENHIGDWDRAREMIVAVAGAGADIVKFQSYRGDEVAANDPEKDWFTEVQLSDELHFELKELAEQSGIEFLSAPFSLSRAKFLVEELGLTKIKVASSEMMNFALLDYLNGRVNTVFLSTGLANLSEVREAVTHLEEVNELCVLQCTTQYPCSPELANLGVISTLKHAFPEHSIGFSDHTIGILAPLVAVSCGASVIEKHFTLNKSLPGTDHVLSVTPEELSQMVEQIREVELLLGDSEKTPTDGEIEIREFVRSRFPKA